MAGSAASSRALGAPASGGFGLDPAGPAIREAAIASMPIPAQAHPKNTKRLLTTAQRLENQNVSRETFWYD
jgi:hypothetical protein